MRTRQPQVSVKLIKAVRRVRGVSARHSGAGATIDLTPYLGEHGSITVQRSLDGLVGGFSVVLVDRMVRETGDTLHSVIEPRDMVEIRFSADPTRQLPLVMRGIVDGIDRERRVGGDRVSQSVTVSGYDLGAIFGLLRIDYRWLIATGSAAPLAGRVPFTEFQIPGREMAPGEWMSEIVDKVVRPYFESTELSRWLRNVRVLASPLGSGVVSPLSYQSFEGTFEALLMKYADRPWNELFLRETETTTDLIFRVAPYRDLYSGQYILPGAVDPGTVSVSTANIESLKVSRGAHRVANWYWVDAPGVTAQTFADKAMVSTLNAAPDSLWIGGGNGLTPYDNARMDLYGINPMNAATNQSQTLNPTHYGSNSALETAAGDVLAFLEERRRQLIAMNRDNVALEQGSAIVLGDETLMPGKYLDVTDNGVVTDSFYIRSVMHNLVPNTSFKTTVLIDRGDGLIRRGAQTASPYLLDARNGVYG